MGRGLGRVQRDILATLEEAKAAMPRYQGARWGPPYGHEGEPGWVSSRGGRVRLPDGVYDLRCSLRYLARRDGQVYAQGEERGLGYVSEGYRVAFSRAARGLLRRGLLVAVSPHSGRPVERRSDGRRHEVRFVRRADAA